MSGRSEHLEARGLVFHVNRWGADGAPAIVVLHGWGDCGATFAPLAECWAEHGPVAAPDMRGFGGTQHAGGTDYLFPEYIPDLDAILDRLAPNGPIVLVGHSMGAQIASLYAGIRPERVSHLVLLDGLHLPDSDPDRAPKRYRQWLHQLAQPPEIKRYGDFDELAARIRRQHPKLDAQRADAIARAWGEADGDGVRLRMDPVHRRRGPLLYRAAESMAIWREITAPVLFVDGGASPFPDAIDAAERTRRRECFADHSVVTIPDTGHMLHFEAPDATAAAVTRWLHAQGAPAAAAHGTDAA
ncbi:alpha/beta hydrolase [Algiphilus sp.]|uniref:alpha/beta fold hydrolase n=1 Tax=Algiphilus sp. TaxID=1872431 RepID=UPI0025C14A20|nr:alpha/beta hydrolase [Algiphilus sp.]MCK5769381.1 alpha/beta hydrolase [Algiphilus sp.]